MKRIFDVLRVLKNASNLRSRRDFGDVFTNRLIKASCENDLVGMIESLAESLDTSVQFIGGERLGAFMALVNDPLGRAMLLWIRKNPRVAAMLCMIKDEDYAVAILDVPLVKIEEQIEDAIPSSCVPHYQIGLKVSLLAPLSHGDDIKAGNSMLFRRRQVLGAEGITLNLPYYSGNAIRGQMRDLLADHFLSSLGLSTSRSEPSVALWFFHALYAGGVLQEGGNDVKAINAALGNHGAASADGIRIFRDTLPALSLIGAAMGNKILSGRLQFGDLRPQCKEWATGNNYAHELLDWLFITRKDNYEGVKSETDETTVQMIANSEVLKEGVILNGGVDYNGHIQPLELSALGLGLELLKNRGLLGGKTREGLGKCAIALTNQPDPLPYLDYLQTNKQTILDYLSNIKALA